MIIEKGITSTSEAVRVINLSNSSHPDLTLITELSVFVRTSIACITFSRSSVTVPNEGFLMYSSNVFIAATAGEISVS
jgi:hypothetical protein